MGIKLQLPKLTDLRPRITVVGIGGAGGNAVNNMIASGLSGVDFVVANTDAQALAASSCETRLQLGVNLTEGLGAGSKPEIGEAAAEEAVDEIRSQVAGSHMVFIAAGMGGGTGTGAASVFARLAKEMDILTVAIVTKPFQFEGSRRLRIAEAGIAELRKYVDTLIVIPNQNLFRIANERTTFAEAFVLADQVLYSGIACIVDLIVKEGLINLDFADVRTVLSGMGTAMMGTGEASGDRRAIVAAEEAVHNPLLDEMSLRGAKGLLVSIIGGRDLTLYEVDEAASRVRQVVDPEANIIVGATFDDSMQDRVRVSIVASGMTSSQMASMAAHAQSYPAQGRQPPSQVSAETAHASGEDFAHALSRVLGHGDGGPRSGDASRRPSAPGWESQDGVTIEEGLGGLGGPAAPPPLPRAQSQPPAGPTPPSFAPAPPQDIRRANRRIPGIDEFPEVGRREYMAKSADGRPSGDAEPAPIRRMGFLERLTGRRKDVANQGTAQNNPQAREGSLKDPRQGAGGGREAGSGPAPKEAPGSGTQPVDPTSYFDRRRG